MWKYLAINLSFVRPQRLAVLLLCLQFSWLLQNVNKKMNINLNFDQVRRLRSFIFHEAGSELLEYRHGP